MTLAATVVELLRRRPLRISRGASDRTTNLFVRLEADGIVGIGEMAPIGYNGGQTAEQASQALTGVAHDLARLSPGDLRLVETALLESGVPSAARAAVNMACWDWLAKKANLPLHRIFGLPRSSPRTSLTVGIDSPEDVARRTEEIVREFPLAPIKLKLGGDGGIEADKARFLAAQGAAEGRAIRVDANGAWSLDDAIAMSAWLSDNGCEYLEQPVSHEREDWLPDLFSRRSCPIFLDECVHCAADVIRVGAYCDGVNVKLMKSGGISEALRIVATARAMGKQTMVGCMSETGVAISAGAAIASLFDYVDLDSHFNIAADPSTGITYEDGRVLPGLAPGLGVTLA